MASGVNAGVRNNADYIFRNIRNAFTGLNNKLEKDVREHLRSVYGTLAFGLASATVGAALHLFTDMFRANFFLSLGSIILMLGLWATPHSAANERKRLGFFVAFCVCTGISSGPLIEQALFIDPSIILTAFLATAIIFGCFTMAALHAPSTKFIHLGGVISSGLLLLMVTAFFSRSVFVNIACLWLAFGIDCMLVLYDTQLICEKRRRGDTDYIWHAIDLFVDFAHLFRCILVLLSDKKAKSRKRND